MNFFAYGQTGSGKTFTTSGPAGVFKKIGDEALNNYPKDFGLFPRAACDIFKAIQNKKEKTIMTINVCESNYQVPLDLVSKKPIKLDPITNDLLG